MRTTIVLMLALTLSTACSTRKKEVREIESEKAQTSVEDSQGLGKTIATLIAESKTITDAQKEQLRSIFAENKRRAEELSAESYKYRAVLVKELLTGKATDSRIKILEKDIERIEKLRLQNTFGTVKKISAIVSGHPHHHQAFAEELMNLESRGSLAR